MTLFLERVKAGLSAAAHAVAAILFLGLLFLVPAANCWGPVVSRSNDGEEIEVPLEEPDAARLSDATILEALSAIYEVAGESTISLDVIIARSPEINAASFGQGRFLFWEGASDLPQEQLDALAAHEVAHELLLHSRRAKDAAALVAFFAEVISVVTGADTRAEQTLRSWLNAATLPRYSRAQELEADDRAVLLLGALGYEDAAAVFSRLLGTLLERYGDTGGGFTDTHPATSERLRLLGAVP